MVSGPLVREPPEIPRCPFPFEPDAQVCEGRRRALSLQSKQERFQTLVGGPQEKGEREGGGGDGGGGSVVSVVSVVSVSSSGSGSLGDQRATPINMKKRRINSKNIKKDREVGRGGRKTSPDNSHTRHISPCSSTPVVSVLQCSRRSPHNTSLVSHTITSHTDAGESCGATDDPNEAAYGLHKCRSAGVIVRAENRAA